MKIVLGYHKGFRRGYVYELECEETDEAKIREVFRTFRIMNYKDNVKENNGFLCMVNDLYIRASAKTELGRTILFKGVDARRAITLLFMENIRVLSIKIYEKEDGVAKKSWCYEEVKRKVSIDNRIVLQSKLVYKENGEERYRGSGRFCIPISFIESEQNLNPMISRGFYPLTFKGEDVAGHVLSCDLVLLDCEEGKANSLDTIDLFYGKVRYGEELCQGIFFSSKHDLNRNAWFEGLYPKYVIGECNDGSSYYRFADVRNSLRYKRYMDYTFEKGAIPMDDEDEMYSMEFAFTTVSKEEAGTFRQKFEREIVNPVFFSKGGLQEEEAEEREHEYKLRIHEKEFRYIAPIKIEETRHSDYCISQDGFGTVIYSPEEGTELRCELAEDVNEWIISYSKAEKNIKVFYSVFSYHTEKDVFQGDKPNGFSLTQISWFLERNCDAFDTIIATLENLYEDKLIWNQLVLTNVDKSQAELLKIRRMIYPDGYVPDETIIKQVYEAKLAYEQSGKEEFPNFVIMGPPGIGKTKLVKNIAAYFTGKEDGIIMKSSSDLKGAYIGHTAIRVFETLVDAAKQNKIVFIDEAYHLQDDKFGREATEILLPLISGDRQEIEARGEKDTMTYSFKKNGQPVPAIWLAGYEHEMRKMLSDNPGLYRRMIKLSLNAPSVSSLYGRILYLSEKQKENVCKPVYEQCEKEIKNYFSWGTSYENVEYFANYAGVEEFHKTCTLRIKADMSEEKKRETLLSVIDEKKREIRKQYMAVITDIKSSLFQVETDIEVNFESVKGNESVIESLKEIVHMLTHRREYTSYGISIPKGALLMGPPGTGKTLLARATAGAIQQEHQRMQEKDHRGAFIAVSATELLGAISTGTGNNNEKSIWKSVGKIEALFREAEEYDTCILFIDEIDIIGKNRNAPGAHVNELIQLMTAMDGFQERKNLFVMAATNAPEILDPALKRPGRFDRTLEVTLPDKEGRVAILKLYLKKLTFLEKCSEKEITSFCEDMASRTRAYSPSELKNTVNEAALLFRRCESYRTEEEIQKKCIHRLNKKMTTQEYRNWLAHGPSELERYKLDFLEMLERLSVGELKKDMKEEKFQWKVNKGSSATSIHEAGHALVGLLLGTSVYEKITVVPRGDALGYVRFNRENELRTKKDFLNHIQIALGGRVAEEMFYGDNISTGASQDIRQATKYAQAMVMTYGMTDEIGPVALLHNERRYLGESGNYQCSDAFRKEADAVVAKLINEQLTVTRNMLGRHKDDIRELAKFIFKKETISGEEFLKKYEELCSKKYK